MKKIIRFRNYVDNKQLMYVTYNKVTGLYNSTDVFADGLEFNGYFESVVIAMIDTQTIGFMLPRAYFESRGSCKTDIVKLCKELSEEHWDEIITRTFSFVVCGCGDLTTVLETFKEGKPISRLVWGDRRIVYRKGYKGITPNDQTIEQWNLTGNEIIDVEPHIQMKDGNKLSEYVMTAEDIVADDWFVDVRPNKIFIESVDK